MTNQARWYGVSTGDGNDGVSHMYADFYVFTDDPWQLARLAAQSMLKPEAFDEAETDGEEDSTISVVVYSEHEYSPADFILEVFPEDDDAWREERGRSYESIEAAGFVA